MSHKESEKSDDQKPAAKWLLGFFVLVEYLTHPLGPLVTRGIEWGLRKASRVRARWVKNCDTRDDLYKLGRQMLMSSQKTITTVSTIGGEEPSKPGANKYVREYFIELCRILYRNRLDSSKTKSIVRYSNLKDSAKCHEALSLLYYGAGLMITHSEVPIEFITVDQGQALVGFPAENGLFGGFSSVEPKKCRVLGSWVAAYCSSEYQATASPRALAEQIEVLRMASGQASHEDDCLCRVATVLNTDDVVKARGETFDKTSDWIDGLYVLSNVQAYYSALAHTVKFERGNETPLTFLDVGCGTALGANELKKYGFSYWGLDVSEPMIIRARNHLGDPVGWTPKPGKAPSFNVSHCDAIGALLEVDPDAKDFIRQAPKNFDVIACQGNSFDSFLGPTQKELALYLFDQRLHEKGYLVFTGAEFPKGVARVDREFFVGGMNRRVQYEFDWAGEYCRLNAKTDGYFLDTSVVMHPCRREWLTALLATLGYEPVDPIAFPVKNVTLRGGHEYYTWVFQRVSGK